jgi:hypothetical protein
VKLVVEDLRPHYLVLQLCQVYEKLLKFFCIISVNIPSFTCLICNDILFCMLGVLYLIQGSVADPQSQY